MTGNRAREWDPWPDILIIAIILLPLAANPGGSTRTAIRAVHEAGRWAAYQVFADCHEPPPVHWITPKPCPPATTAETTGAMDGTAAPSPTAGEEGADR